MHILCTIALTMQYGIALLANEGKIMQITTGRLCPTGHDYDLETSFKKTRQQTMNLLPSNNPY